MNMKPDDLNDGVRSYGVSVNGMSIGCTLLSGIPKKKSSSRPLLFFFVYSFFSFRRIPFLDMSEHSDLQCMY